jgi:hypothetical protein
MQHNAAENTQTRRLALGLTALGGALAGALITATFLYSQFISPPVFYALFALGGGIYGVFAGMGIRLLLPRFGLGHIARYAALVSLGFLGGCLIGFARSEIIFWTALALPPLIGAIFGHIARRWIAKAGDFPPIIGKPGWALGAVVFSPLYLLLGFLLMLVIVPRLLTVGVTPLSILPAVAAGALGGWISGRISANNIGAGLAYRAERSALQQKPQVLAAAIHTDSDAVPAALGTLAQQQVAAAEPLEVVDERDEVALKQKTKTRSLDIPLPETPRQWRMVLGSGVLVFAAAAVFFSLFPTRVVEVMVTPTYPLVTPLPYPTDIPSMMMLPTPTPPHIDPSLPLPRYSVGEQVQVLNLSPDLQGYTDFWIRGFYYADNTWIYEVTTADGVIFVRSEAQIQPTIERMTASPEPLPTYTATPMPRR